MSNEEIIAEFNKEIDDLKLELERKEHLINSWISECGKKENLINFLNAECKKKAMISKTRLP